MTRFALSIACTALVCLSACEGEDVEAGAAAREVARKQQSALLARESLRSELSRDPANLVPVRRSDGLKQWHVQSGFRHATVITRQPDGGLSRGCIEDPRALQSGSQR